MKISHQRGVSLLEVLISLLIIAFGALGLAKMQALTISDAATSGSRSIIAMQASSLAAMMRANPAYWQPGTAASPTTPVCFSNSGGASTCANMSGATTTLFGTAPAVSACTYAAPCTPTQIAALDVTTWMANMNVLVPSYALNITCSNSLSVPTSCLIKITWYEKQQGMNTTTATMATNSNLAQQSYFEYVQP